jgi:MFS family permease
MFGDIASEMLYPVIPVYLKEIGFSVVLIGLLEGVAEFVVGLSKGYFGKLSDQRGVRLPFVRLGYLLSAFAKPMVGLFTTTVPIFIARSADRLGKGVRTAARDAILSQEATRETKARVFGFHRTWDTIGAFTGPIIALVYLHFYPHDYRTFFLIAFIPGIASVLMLYLLKEKKATATRVQSRNFFSYFSYWKTASPEYRKLLTGLMFFGLFNSSDIFLLLRTKEITGSNEMPILAYIFYNLVYAAISYPMGVLADKLGTKKILLTGLVFFAVTYAGFAFATQTWMIFGLFLIYGLYAGATDGVAKAWITNLANDNETATAIGFFTSCQSIFTMLASVLAGLIWENFGAAATFGASAAATLIAALYLRLTIRRA